MTIFGKITAMFPFKTSLIVSVFLGGLFGFTAVAQAWQSETQASKKVSSRRAIPDNHLKLSDSTQELSAAASDNQLQLSNTTQRTMSDNRRKLSDPIPNSAAAQRKLSDSNRKLSDSPTQPMEYSSVGSEASELRTTSSRRVLSDSEISNIQISLTDQATQPDSESMQASISIERSPSEANGTKLIDSVDQFKEENAIATISAGVPQTPTATRQTAYLNSQEIDLNTRPAGSSSLSKSSRRNFQGVSDTATVEATPKPMFVNPESFRVPSGGTKEITGCPASDNVQYSIPNAGSAEIPDGPTFYNASAPRTPNWKRWNQDEVEVDLQPQEITPLEYDSNSKITNFSDSDYDDEDAATALPPVGNISQSLGYDPLRSAFGSHTIGDPYIASRSFAPEFRADATSKIKTWRSPNLKHRPLYFEDAALERHGQSLPKLQPAVSGARFFSSVVLLPQKILATRPTECVHPVGYGRPGDCTENVRETLPRRGE